MKTLAKKSLCAFLFCLYGWVHSSLHAEPFRRTGQGIRNLGMGNVGVALSYDENALQYNPAGLIGVEDWFFDWVILAEVSNDIFNNLNQFNNLSSNDREKIINLAVGKDLYGRVMTSTNLVLPFKAFTVGFSILGEAALNLAIENPVLPEANLSFRVDAPVYTVGAAIPFDRKRFVLGLATRSVTRTSLSGARLSIDTLLVENSQEKILERFSGATKAAVGQGYDVGMQWRIEGNWGLTLGAVAHNLGGLLFSKSNREFPKDIPPEYSVGFSLQPTSDYLKIHEEYLRVLYAFDLRDLTRQGTSDQVWVKRIHTGLEWGILPIDSSTSFIALRTGFNQGYWTYGFEINPLISSRYVTLEAAVYPEETGTVAGGGSQIRRVAQISFGF